MTLQGADPMDPPHSRTTLSGRPRLSMFRLAERSPTTAHTAHPGAQNTGQAAKPLPPSLHLLSSADPSSGYSKASTCPCVWRGSVAHSIRDVGIHERCKIIWPIAYVEANTATTTYSAYQCTLALHNDARADSGPRQALPSHKRLR